MMRTLTAMLLTTVIVCLDASAQSVDFGALLDEMVDRDSLAKTPIHDFTLRQSSSYDRASIAPDKPGWYANGDGGGFIRTEVNQGRTERVLLDVQGPGAIVRFWSTYLTWEFSDGALRFYFDGAETPQIEGPFTEIFHGSHLAGSPLAQTTGGFVENNHILGGQNLYLPLPYANGCKITYEGTDNPFYYAINYREYDEATDVTTFSMNDLERHQTKLELVERELANNEKMSPGLQRSTVAKKTIEPGQSAPLTTVEGSRAIRELALRLDAADHAQALRSTVLEIRFDGAPTVWAPIGDFFGTGYRLSPYESRYHKVTLDGRLLCRWVMPFKEGAQITIHNHGQQPITIDDFAVDHGPWQWDDRSLYFHAAWRLYAEAPSARGRDTNYVTLKGEGKYVGDSLALFNATSGQEGQPWWGEGDEKIYIDGETFPSHFGTGTEDYYGYAWVGAAPFSMPFLAQPRAQGNRGRGLSVVSRSRVLDAMPFKESLKFDMEIWHWVDGVTVDYAPTTFWYGPLTTRPVADLDANPVEPLSNDVVGVRRAVRTTEPIEAEGLRIEPGESGESFVHTLPNDRRLSNRSYWMVRGIKPGHEATASFFSPEAGRRDLDVVLIRSENAATIDLLVNDEVVASQIDLHSDALAPYTHSVRGVQLRKGRNDFTVRASEIEGREPPANEIGVDYLQFRPAR